MFQIQSLGNIIETSEDNLQLYSLSHSIINKSFLLYNFYQVKTEKDVAKNVLMCRRTYTPLKQKDVYILQSGPP